MRWCSNRRPRSAALLSLFVAGCAGSAPPLPTDTTSVNRTHDVNVAEFTSTDVALSCDAIAAERQSIASRMREANGRIEGNRTRDQVAFFVGGVIAVPFIADSNDPERDEIRQLYQRRDTLIKLAAAKNCPPS